MPERNVGAVDRVDRLQTLVELDDHDDPRTMSVYARHEAVLPDGRGLLLLDDRGWTWALNRRSAEVPDIWAATSVQDIEADARAVVGPDEPAAGRSREETEAGHWAFISEVLRRQGVIVGAAELRSLPHDVVIGERLRARLTRRSSRTSPSG
jgi:hypothetical protein